jgi:hypothetical protein
VRVIIRYNILLVITVDRSTKATPTDRMHESDATLKGGKTNHVKPI